MMSKKNITKIQKNTPNKKLLTSDDLAKIINDVFQDHWKHSNGAILDINGGIYQYACSIGAMTLTNDRKSIFSI